MNTKEQLELFDDALRAIMINSEDEELRAEIQNIRTSPNYILWEMENEPQPDTDFEARAIVEVTRERLRLILNGKI